MEFPRLRWLALLQLVAMIAASMDTGSILQALQSAGVVAPGVVSLVLFILRTAQAFQAIDVDEFVHTMDGSPRSVKPVGLWERVW